MLHLLRRWGRSAAGHGVNLGPWGRKVRHESSENALASGHIEHQAQASPNARLAYVKNPAGASPQGGGRGQLHGSIRRPQRPFGILPRGPSVRPPKTVDLVLPKPVMRRVGPPSDRKSVV